MTGSHDLDEGEPRSAIRSAPAEPRKDFRVTLKKRADFQRASRGRRCNARSVGLQAFKRPEGPDDAPRFGLTVTKRVGNAVERNRIKRRLRAVLREAAIAPETCHDYVIVARREALGIVFTGLVADLSKALDQARDGRGSSRHRKPSRRTTTPDPSP